MEREEEKLRSEREEGEGERGKGGSTKMMTWERTESGVWKLVKQLGIEGLRGRRGRRAHDSTRRGEGERDG
jgi:hypothetical protein